MKSREWEIDAYSYFDSLNYTSCLEFAWLQIVVLRPLFRFCGWFLVTAALFGVQLWFRVLLLLVRKDLFVKTAIWKLFTMSMWDLTSDNGHTMAHEHAETPDERTMCWPQAYSTMLGAHGKESGYSTRENGVINSAMEADVYVSEKIWNGEGNLELDRTAIEKRQPKLTEKGKAYRPVTKRKRERNKLKREIQLWIANIGTLMGLDENLEQVGKESVKLKHKHARRARVFFCDLKAPRGCSTRWTHSRVLVPDSSQCHYRVKYSCTNFDDCCP